MSLRLFGYCPGNSNLAGETQDEQMAAKKAFDLLAFDLGAMAEVELNSRRAEAERTEFAPLSIVKNIDRVSIELFKMLTTGSHIDELVIEARRPNEEGHVEFLKYEMRLVMVANIEWSASNHPARPGDQEERMELQYGAIKVSYTGQDPKTGKPAKPNTATWSALRNKATLKV